MPGDLGRSEYPFPACSVGHFTPELTVVAEEEITHYAEQTIPRISVVETGVSTIVNSDHVISGYLRIDEDSIKVEAHLSGGVIPGCYHLVPLPITHYRAGDSVDVSLIYRGVIGYVG